MTVKRFEEKTYNTDSLDFSLWKRIFSLMKKQKKRLIRLAILNSIIALFDVAIPFLNKIAIDTFAVGKGSLSEIRLFAIVFIVGTIIQCVSVFFYFIEAGHTEMNNSYDMRNSLFQKLQTLSYSYFDVTPAGWLLSRITSDVARLSEILSWSLMELFWGFTSMVGAVIVMFWANWKLALMVIVIIPFLAMIASYFNIRILKNYREVRRINSKITNGFNEGIAGAKTTKTLVLEEVNFQEFEHDTHSMKKAAMKAITMSSVLYPSVMMLSSFSLAALLSYGGHQVLLQTLQFGTLVMFTEYARQFFEPLNQIAALVAELQMAQASAERILSLLDEEPKIQDTPEVIEKYGTVLNPKRENYEPLYGDIEFSHVSFHYNEKEEILKDFNLTVKQGERIALVGETGSGKSTIVNLLCRFYEPTEGQILIDGRDYKERSVDWLHSHLGYVLQSPFLFSGTIEENIRFGRLDATLEEIQEACKLVKADEFIQELENGYQTEVGEGGGKLSTGQKQLISFARALIANPSILILDEATSSVDTETELVIQDAMEQVMQGRTSFIVAHRLSTIVNADKILVIKKGKIVESGTHDELMKKEGYYYRLYTNQFHESLELQLLGKKKTFA